jgi:ABC-type antimicrobial peptide transport system permease subunit
VVRDVKIRSLDEEARPVIYAPRAQHLYYNGGRLAAGASINLIVRTQQPTAQLADALAAIARDVDLSFKGVTTLDDTVEGLLMPQRLGRSLLTLLGVMALTLTVVGIYGVVSCVVSRRTKEIGIRLALGAARRDIVIAMIRGAVVPVAVGAALGGIGAVVGGRGVDRFMYGLEGSDPGTMAIALAVILAIGALAALSPTRRAVRVNPVDALRAD